MMRPLTVSLVAATLLVSAAAMGADTPGHLSSRGVSPSLHVDDHRAVVVHRIHPAYIYTTARRTPPISAGPGVTTAVGVEERTTTAQTSVAVAGYSVVVDRRLRYRLPVGRTVPLPPAP